MDQRLTLSVVLAFHLAVAIVHGTSHALLPVPLPPWQNVLVLVAVFIGPIVGVVLALRGHSLGLPLFTISMLSAFLLGGVLHFLVENPDHIHMIPEGRWRLPFRMSAAGVAVMPAVGTVVGAWYWRTRSHQ